MLFKNHVKVEFVNDPLYEQHKNEFEQLIKGKKSIVVRTQDKIRINATGYKERDRGQTVPVTSIVRNPSGTDDDYWVYSARAPKLKQNGEKEYDKTPIVITREANVPVNEKDKLFYLLYISKAGQNGRIFALNEEKEDNIKAAKIGEGARLNFMIFDDMSPVTETTIRRIAKAFGVGNVDTLPTAKVKLLLKGIVEVADSSNDVYRCSKAFFDAINMDDATNTRAMVQEAIDSGRIQYDSVESSYFYCNSEGEKIRKVMNIDLLISGDKIKRMNSLANYFITNETKRKELSQLLNYSTDDTDFSAYTYASLKRWLSLHGESGKGSLEEIVERATNLYSEKKDEMKFDMSALTLIQRSSSEVEV
jgi:hypothetical protein